jgi:hypothetical protein
MSKGNLPETEDEWLAQESEVANIAAMEDRPYRGYDPDATFGFERCWGDDLSNWR